MPAAPSLGLWCLFLLLCVLSNRAALAYARHRQLLDMPDSARRSHQVATPRGGGSGIVASLFVGMMWLATMVEAPMPVLLSTSGALLLVGGVGWWDDHRPLPAVFRLGVHLLAGVLVALALHLSGASLAWCLLALLVVPMGINLWNFMDGINGLVTLQVGLFALCASWLMDSLVWSSLAAMLGIAVFSFLPLNFPRARIFLGDVGSGSLGLMVAVVWLFGAIESTIPAICALILPLLPILVDSLFTIVWRISRRQHLLQAHAEHLYQKAVRHGYPHWQVTGIYALVSLALILAAAGVQRLPPLLAVAITLLICTGCVAAWMFARLRCYR